MYYKNSGKVWCQKGGESSRKKIKHYSKYLGVTKGSRCKYRAQINMQGHIKIIMESDDEVKCAKAYDKWAEYYFGKDARLNFPKEVK